MTIENLDPTHECSPKHLQMGTVKFKYDKETGRRQADKSENNITVAVKNANNTILSECSPSAVHLVNWSSAALEML